MYSPAKHLDAPQHVLIEALETDFAVNIVTGPAGDTHFDYADNSHFEWGWDFGQSWVPGMAIYQLCQNIGLDVDALYEAIRRRAPGVLEEG